MPVRNDAPLSPVRSHEELLGVIPHLLGFHPEESLVLLVLVSGRLELTARLDLDAVGGPGALPGIVAQIGRRFAGARLTGIAYSAEGDRAWRVLALAERAAGERWEGGVHVDGKHWWLGPGRPGGPYRPGDSIAAAEATVLGLQARPSRASLAEQLATDPGVGEWQRRAFERARQRGLADPGDPGRALTGLLAEVLAGRVELDDGCCARLAALATSSAARDAAVLFTRDTHADALVELWTRVVRRVPRPAAVAPLGLLGLAAWVRGDGALQNVCLEQGLLIEPGHRLLGVLDDINSSMLAPHQWPGLRAALARSVRDDRRRTARRRR